MTSYIPKPLVWEESELAEGMLIAQSIIGDLEVFGGPEKWWCEVDGGPTGQGFKTIEEAKAEAEKRYLEILLRALDEYDGREPEEIPPIPIQKQMFT